MSILPAYNKLTTSQRNFLDEYIDSGKLNSTNVWINGLAGTGKSVLLAYSAEKILRKDKNKKIICVVYTHSLISMYTEAFREINIPIRVVTMYKFMKSYARRERFDYILCDEIQDFPATIIEGMKSSCDHLIVAGDQNQSIYDFDIVYDEETVSPMDIDNLLSPSKQTLTEVVRMPVSIIKILRKFMPKINWNLAKNMMDHDTEVRLCKSTSQAEEITYVYREALKAVRISKTAVILLETEREILKFANELLRLENKQVWERKTNAYGKCDWNSFNNHLRKNSIHIQYLGKGYGRLTDNEQNITIMTYHSAKGLDFDYVFMPGLTPEFFSNSASDMASTLLMVGLTRCKNSLFLTYTNIMNRMLSSFAGDCNKINVHNALAGPITENKNETKTVSGNIFGI